MVMKTSNPLSIKTKNHQSKQSTNSIEEPLTPIGVTYGVDSGDRWMNHYILGIFGLEKQISISSLKSSLADTVLKHDRFCSIQKECKNGTKVWVRKENIDIDEHIIVVEWDEIYTKNSEFVEKYAASLATYPPIDSSRPMWEVHVLNYPSNFSEAALIFRTHHAIGDCISLMSLLLDSTRRHDCPQSKPTIPKITRNPRIGYPQWTVIGFLSWVWRVFYCLWTTLYEVLRTIPATMDQDSEFLRGSVDLINSPKKLAHFSVNMEDLQIIKKATTSTINDVVLGIINAGLVEYLQHLQEERKLPGVKKASDLVMNAIIPVNLRTPPGLQDVNEMMKKENQNIRWGNKNTVWSILLPLGKQHKWLDYCRMSKRMLEKKKKSYAAEYTYFITCLLSRLVGWKMCAEIMNWGSLRKSLVFSNVQGPMEEVQFAGVKITRMLTALTGSSMAIVIYLHTYANKAEVTMLAGDGSFADPEKLCNQCSFAFGMMKAEALLLSVNHCNEDQALLKEAKSD